MGFDKQVSLRAEHLGTAQDTMSSGGRRRILLVLVCIATVAGCASYGGRSKPAAVPEFRPGLLVGYLPTNGLPNSLALLPPPPAIGSAALALDEDIARRSVALRDTPRWALAVSDADLMFPHAAGTFSCALGAPITEEDAPHLYMLLRRTLTDAGLSTYAAKNHFKRDRPFELNKEPICTPNEKAMLEKDGSYPSGHTAVGWAWVLILSEISPEQTDEILARGRAFGESRNVCNVHWHSDVIQGRFMGAGTVARLHADPTFRADLEAAKAELAAVRANSLKPTRDCNAEASAMSLVP
jgi:acid phosphatase (class A)